MTQVHAIIKRYPATDYQNARVTIVLLGTMVERKGETEEATLRAAVADARALCSAVVDGPCTLVLDSFQNENHRARGAT